MELLQAKGLASDENIAIEKAQIEKQGMNANAHRAVVIVWYKSVVVAAFSLLVSTFASSSLFTIVVSAVVFFIGHFQALAREYWQATEMDSIGGMLAGLIAIIFPDLSMYNVVEQVMIGEELPWAVLAKLGGFTALYVLVYQVLAWLFFANKEL